MSVLDNVLANQHDVADLAARIVRLRDHLVGASAIENPPIAPSAYAGVLGDIDVGVAQNAAILKVAADAFMQLEQAFGV